MTGDKVLIAVAMRRRTQQTTEGARHYQTAWR